MNVRRLLVGASAVAALGMIPAAVEAQCPVVSTCYFGTDVNGSADSRATNVNSLIARNNFFSALSGVGTEDFEGQSGGSPLALVFPGAGSATLNGGGSVVSQGPGTNGVGRYPISGSNYWSTEVGGFGSTFSIAFANPVAAFGFYGVDIGEFRSQLTLRFSLVGGGTADWQLPYTATNGTNTLRDGSILYAGFINSTQFTGVEFLGTDDTDVFAFDDMTIGSIGQVVIPPGTVVPEPSTYAMMAAGLAAIAFIRKRRKA
ncbi:MAG: PEP-CTERM sorting domain-containing protein [Gemmatimonas sp.]